MDGQVARGDRVGDRVDQERHVVVDDRDPHPPPAGLAAGRFDAGSRASPGWRSAATSAMKRGRLGLLRGAEAVEFAGQAHCREALAASRRSSPLAARVMAVMSCYCSACLAMRGGLVPRAALGNSRERSELLSGRRGGGRGRASPASATSSTTSCTPSALRRVRTSANSSLVGKLGQRERRRGAQRGLAQLDACPRPAGRGGAPCARRRPGP